MYSLSNDHVIGVLPHPRDDLEAFTDAPVTVADTEGYCTDNDAMISLCTHTPARRPLCFATPLLPGT